MHIFLITIFVINIGIGFAEAIPIEQWNKVYTCQIAGFTNCESRAESVQEVSDGIVIAGYNYAYSWGDSQYTEGWLRKTNSYGTLLWTKIYTEPFQEYIIKSVRQTSNGYILAGISHDTIANRNVALIIKTDGSGNKLWAKRFEGYEASYAQQTTDGNYVFAGETGGGAWLYKFNNLGNKIWEKIYSDATSAASVMQTKDGGFILTGWTNGKSFLLKTDINGNKVWMYFGRNDSTGNFVQQTTDGGYIIAGSNFIYGTNYGDGWGIKTNMFGYRLWDKSFATNSNDDYMYSVKETKDTGFIFAGQTHNPSDGKNCDAWIVKTDKLGVVQWNKKIGGYQCDTAKSIQQTKDLGFIFVGQKGSSAWIQKLIEPYLGVTSPNGGEKFVRGTTKTIKWNYSGNPGSFVKIDLLKGGVLNRVITYSTSIGSSGSGSYNWVVPSTQTLGTDYKIRVTSTSNSAYTDTSNNNFVISNPYITIISPNGGESWQRSTTKTITWKKEGNVGSYVKIDLYKAGVFKQTIVASTPNDGSHPWYIPGAQTLGTDYKIKITSASNSAYNDWSNNNFKIY